MEAASPELVGRVERVTRECERFFRAQLFDAQTIADRALAELGLRHAVGLQKAVAQVPVAGAGR